MVKQEMVKYTFKSNDETKVGNNMAIEHILDKLSVEERVVLYDDMSKRENRVLWIGLGLGVLGTVTVIFEIAFFMVV